MEKQFSERFGYKMPKVSIQIESVNTDLRNSLWNALDENYWTLADWVYDEFGNAKVHLLMRAIWQHYFKSPWDEVAHNGPQCHGMVRAYFFNCPWYEVYDFIEFVANNFQTEPYGRISVNANFMAQCNAALERELSAWRFVGNTITPITSRAEISEITKALHAGEPVATHIATSLALLSDRKSPDYRNSIKESISAVEAMCKKIAGKQHLTLAEALKNIGPKLKLHKALVKGFGSLYGYTSETDGIRHALSDEPNLRVEDALFMLVACSAFVNYLGAKHRRTANP